MKQAFTYKDKKRQEKDKKTRPITTAEHIDILSFLMILVPLPTFI